ncbi:MAG: ATP synthase F0 subunit B [SAR324 cluster bacterium]|nr:ATP synthase F0 subunit B [SAR324 cluster bacterium]
MFQKENMFRLFTLILFVSFWSTALYAAGSGGSSSMDFIWKVVNVVVLAAIIYKFAKKPVAAALGSSAESAKKVIDDARNAEEKISADLSEMHSKIAGLEKEALEMVEAAKKDAEDAKARIVEEGKLEIQRMKEQASFALKQEQRKAEDDLRRWIAEESVKLAEGTLKKEMNQNEQKKLVKNFMDQLNQSKGAA